jgi:hypothetical protein
VGVAYSDFGVIDWVVIFCRINPAAQREPIWRLAAR